MTPGISPTTDHADVLDAVAYGVANPANTALTVVSGTAQQDTTGLPSNVYLNITGGASGTVTVAIGPTSGVAITVISSANATLNQTVDFNLPANWYFKCTVGGSAAVGTGHQQVTGI